MRRLQRAFDFRTCLKVWATCGDASTSTVSLRKVSTPFLARNQGELRWMSTVVPPGKTLGEVTHVDLLEKENPDDIATIWRQYHEGKSGRVGLKVEPEAYRSLEKRSGQCPIFVMPLHKSPGRFLSLVMQTKLPYVSFTAIDDFRKLQEAATPVMVAAHYPELIDSKGLALVQAAHVDATTAGAVEHLTGQEAVRLVRLCHIFYGDDELYEKFVKPFNHKQKDFDFDSLVAEVSRRTWGDDVIQ
jgi:ATP synthase F1 complex assembly factor 1